MGACWRALPSRGTCAVPVVRLIDASVVAMMAQRANLMAFPFGFATILLGTYADLANGPRNAERRYTGYSRTPNAAKHGAG
jgi:hypothetical protein